METHSLLLPFKMLWPWLCPPTRPCWHQWCLFSPLASLCQCVMEQGCWVAGTRLRFQGWEFSGHSVGRLPRCLECLCSSGWAGCLANQIPAVNATEVAVRLSSWWLLGCAVPSAPISLSLPWGPARPLAGWGSPISKRSHHRAQRSGL